MWDLGWVRWKPCRLRVLWDFDVGDRWFLSIRKSVESLIFQGSTETTVEVILGKMTRKFDFGSLFVDGRDTLFGCQGVLLDNVNHAPLYKSKIAQYYTIRLFLQLKNPSIIIKILCYDDDNNMLFQIMNYLCKSNK